MAFVSLQRDGLTLWQSSLLGVCGVPHAFTTRAGGVSKAPYESLNLGNPAGLSLEQSDSSANIEINYHRLQQALGLGKAIRAQVQQVHGNAVVLVPDDQLPPRLPAAPEADALVTRRRNCLLTVRVADCLPLLICDEEGQTVAAVHAGWRGAVAGVATAAVAALERLGAPPAKLRCALGPAISSHAFEVGEEVAQAFQNAGLEKAIRRDLGRKPHICLPTAVRVQLEAAGILGENIDVAGQCTFHHLHYFSHRRSGPATGRNAAVIAPRQS